MKRRTSKKESPAPKKRQKVQDVQKKEKKEVEKVSLPKVESEVHPSVPGDVFVWGQNNFGNLGLGEDVPSKLRPNPLPMKLAVLQIACGGMHCVALLMDRSVWSWGVNDEGALGRETIGPPWDDASEATGKPLDYYTPQPVSLPSTHGSVVYLSAGDSHTVATTDIGALYQWGTFRNNSGVLGFSSDTKRQLTPELIHNPTTTEQQIVKTASGNDHVIAMSASGHVYTWGQPDCGQLGRRTRATRDALTPRKIGHIASYLPGPNTKNIGVGACSSYVISSTGEVYACGLNNYGQLGLDGVRQMDFFTQLEVWEGEEEVKVVSACGGEHHSVLLSDSGGVYSVGRVTSGALGLPGKDVDSNDCVVEATKVTDEIDGVGIKDISAYGRVSGAIGGPDERIWLWGDSENDRLANGDNDDDEPVPTLCKFTKQFYHRKVVALSVGASHAACLARQVEEEDNGGKGDKGDKGNKGG